MEPVSAAIGVVSLLPAFKAAVDSYLLFKDFFADAKPAQPELAL